MRHSPYLVLVLLFIAFPACYGRSGSAGSPGSPGTPGISVNRKQLGQNVLFEIAGDQRRVLIEATVCLREGYLEHLLSRTEAGKQHESILTAEFDAEVVHTALLAAQAKAGRPVQFYNERQEPDFKPPTGDKIKVTLEYKQQGKTITIPAQRWVRETKTKRELTHDWVFAGSRFFDHSDPQKPPIYGANDGRVICLSNFTTAMLDLPIASADSDPRDGGLLFEANTPLIPPLETKVTVILEPKK